jgi:ketosteroid isomerase-like protein
MSTSNAVSNQGVDDILRGIEDGLATAWVERDRAFIEATLADDWSVTDAAGRVLTRAQVLEEGFVSGERRLVSGWLDDIDVRSFGDWAVVTGRSHVRGRYQGEVKNATLRFTDVFAHRDGRWQIVASHATLLKE